MLSHEVTNYSQNANTTFINVNFTYINVIITHINVTVTFYIYIYVLNHIYWASEASPTLGCSIEISRDIYIYVYMLVCLVCQINCVGGIT